MKKSKLNWNILLFFTIFLAAFGVDKWYLGKKNLAIFKGLTLSIFGFFGIFFLIIVSTPNLGSISSMSFPQPLFSFGVFIIIIYVLSVFWYFYDIIMLLMRKTKDHNNLLVTKN